MSFSYITFTLNDWIALGILIQVLTLPILWVLFYFLFNTLAGDTTRFRIVWIFGALVDIWVNVTWGTTLFAQKPHYTRLFLSARMDDLILNDSSWRCNRAIWIVSVFLAPYDKTGQHTTHGKTL